MPTGSEIAKRNRALFAFVLLTGAPGQRHCLHEAETQAIFREAFEAVGLPYFNPRQNDLLKVNDFTARGQPSASDPNVDVRQTPTCAPAKLIVLVWNSTTDISCATVFSWSTPTRPPASVAVWKNEEKVCGVSLALSLLNDAWRDDYDCAVVVSNDSDLAEALRLLKTQHHKIIGLVTPGAPVRKTSRQLRQHADFVRPVRTWMLRTSQLLFHRFFAARGQCPRP